MSPKDKKMLALKEREKKSQILYNHLSTGHKKPKTRRDFLTSGLLSFAGTMMAPSLTQLLSQSAWAQSLPNSQCPSAAGGFPTFINLQLAGGPALFANFLGSKAGGQTFGDYSKFGMGSKPVRTTLFSNSAPFWGVGPGSKGSPMMNKMLETIGTNTDILDNSAFIAICANTTQDTSDNASLDKLDLTGMLTKIGAIGTHLPYTSVLGNVGKTIGADRAVRALFDGAVLDRDSLLMVDSAQSLKGSLQFGGPLGRFPGSVQEQLQTQTALATLIEDLNKYQVEQIARNPDSHESQKIFKSLIQCASQKNKTILSQTPKVDIYDAAYGDNGSMANIFNTSGITDPDAVSAIQGVGLSVASSLGGISGGSIITLGGYDYHTAGTKSRTEADIKDAFAGDIIARILLTAKAKNKSLFLFISEDGSISPDVNTNSGNENVLWTSDNETTGMGYIIAYNPNGTPPETQGFNLGAYSDASFQLNHFNNDFEVAKANPISGKSATELYASAVFLNYLNFAKKGQLIDNPALEAVKKQLTNALPPGANSIFDYYTRIKG